MFGATAGRTAAESAALLGRLIRDGARGEVAGRWVAEAAHETDGRDVLAMARALAARMRAAVAYARDAYGADDAQTIEATIFRTAGDCEDLAVAFGAVAMRAGARVALAIERDGEGVPVHVLPLVEHPTEARWLPVDLTDRGYVFGRWPREVARFEVFEVVARSGASLGFLGDLIGGVVGLFTKNKELKTAKKVAQIDADAKKAEAAALTETAKLQAETVKASEAAANLRTAATLATFQDIVKRSLPVVVVATVARPLLDVVGAFAGRKRRR